MVADAGRDRGAVWSWRGHSRASARRARLDAAGSGGQDLCGERAWRRAGRYAEWLREAGCVPSQRAADQLSRGCTEHHRAGRPECGTVGSGRATARHPLVPLPGRAHPGRRDQPSWHLTIREQDDGRFLVYDAGSLGEVRRSPTAAELTADGASLSASQWGLRRVAEQRAEGSEVKPEDGREGPVRYADGGRVGLVAQAAEAPARALLEGVAPSPQLYPLISLKTWPK